MSILTLICKHILYNIILHNADFNTYSYSWFYLHTTYYYYSFTIDRILSLQNNSFIVRCKKRDIGTMDLSVPRCAKSVNIIAVR